MTANSIKRLRKRLGLSQGDFADKIGIDQATVSRIENGKPPSKPVLKIIQQIAAES